MCRVALQKQEHSPKGTAPKSQPTSMRQADQPATVGKHKSEDVSRRKEERGVSKRQDEGRGEARGEARGVSRKRRQEVRAAAASGRVNVPPRDPVCAVGVPQPQPPRESGELKLFELTRALKRFKHDM